MDVDLLRPMAPGTAMPGTIVFFRYNGTGDPRPVRVCPRGPRNQCYVHFIDDRGADLPNGFIAVNDNRELWTS